MALRGAVLIMLSAVVMQAEGFQVIGPERSRAAAGVLLPLPCRSTARIPVAPRSLRSAVLSMAASDGILIVGGGPRSLSPHCPACMCMHTSSDGSLRVP